MHMTETSRRLSDASSSDPSISSWTATKWLDSDFCLPQVPEGGSYEPNEPPLRTGLVTNPVASTSHPIVASGSPFGVWPSSDTTACARQPRQPVQTVNVAQDGNCNVQVVWSPYTS